jgi:hypothetical protein
VASTGNGRLAIDGPSTFVTLKSSPKKEQKVIHKRLQMKTKKNKKIIIFIDNYYSDKS